MLMFDRPLFADDMGIPMDIDAEAKVIHNLLYGFHIFHSSRENDFFTKSRFFSFLFLHKSMWVFI